MLHLTNKSVAALPSQQRRARPLKYLVWLLLWFAVLSLVAVNRQNLEDSWRIHNFKVPPQIAAIASADTMTPYARKVFYVNKPQLDNKTTFAPICPSGTEQTVVLGCYKGGQNGIFLLEVSDPRLAGLEQVTAAHEMLHAAYDRLSTKERTQVNGWLMNYYQHDLHDPVILDQINAYKQSEPNDVVNEMHSVFGTEAGNLPAQLENYYKRYFTQRSTIVKNYNNYQGEFTSRQTQIKLDDTQLNSWKTQIDTYQADLKLKNAALATQQGQITMYRSSGNTAAYNGAVIVYNQGVDNYNSEVETVKSLIAQYNQLVATRNALALEAQQLTNEISSQVSPVSQ